MKVKNPILNKRILLATVLNRVDEILILEKLKKQGYHWENNTQIIPNPQYFRRDIPPYNIYRRSTKCKEIYTLRK